MKVDLFVPCFIDLIYPKVGLASLDILKRFGCEINFNPKQTCCGQPAFNSGYWDEAKKIAEYFYSTFSGENIIVSPSGSCVSMVKIFYKELLQEKEYLKLSSRIFEISDFIYSILKRNFSDIEYNGKVILHEACHATRELKILEKVKLLLSSIKGLELTDFPNHEECCGFGGTFSAKFPKLSIDMGKDKIKNYNEADSKIVLSTDSSCLMHQEGIAKNMNYDFKFYHIIEFVNNLYKQKEEKL